MGALYEIDQLSFDRSRVNSVDVVHDGEDGDSTYGQVFVDVTHVARGLAIGLGFVLRGRWRRHESDDSERSENGARQVTNLDERHTCDFALVVKGKQSGRGPGPESPRVHQDWVVESRKETMRFVWILALITSFSLTAPAQSDPSVLLLNSGSSPADRDRGLEAGRYTVRPKENSKESKIPRAQQSAPGESKPEVTEPRVAAPNATPTPAANFGPPVLNPQATPQPEAPLQTQQEVRDDRRLTMLELAVAPGYLYNVSDSSYSFRSYNASAPTVSIDAKVWLTPMFAVHTSYLGTVSGNVNDSSTGTRNIAATQQWNLVGLRSRKFFGATRLAPTLEFGLDYYEYEFRVPSDAQVRERLKSTGAQLSLEAEVPTSPYRSYTLGFSFLPKLQHKETATSVDFQSGGSVDANGVGLSLGSKIRFDRSNAMFWKLTYSVEKDVFGGDASLADPLTGIAPSGVSVTNTFSLIQLGYTWGD